jgi:hypothetical protein
VLREGRELEVCADSRFLLAESGLDFRDFAGVAGAFHDYCADDKAGEPLEDARVYFEGHGGDFNTGA